MEITSFRVMFTVVVAVVFCARALLVPKMKAPMVPFGLKRKALSAFQC